MTQLVGNAPWLPRTLGWHDSHVRLGRNYHLEHAWNTPESFARWLAENRASIWCKGILGKSDGFYGEWTFDEAVARVEMGWAEGAAQARALARCIATKVPIVRRHTRYALAGSRPHVPRALAGQPLHMHAPEPGRSRRRPIVSIVVNIQSLSNIKSTSLTNRAVAMAAVVDAIEGAAYSCEVVVYAPTHGTDICASAAIIAKRAGQALDLSRFVVAVGHASFYRRLCFGAWASDEGTRPIGSGLGRTSSVWECAYPTWLPRDTYYIPTIGALCPESAFCDDAATVHKGVPWLVAKLRADGCPGL